MYTIAMGGQALSALLVLPIITRVLNEGQYGIYVTGALTTRLAAIAAVAGIPAAITVFYFARPDGDRLARQLVLATTGFAIAFAVTADLTGQWWSAVFANLSYGPILRVAIWSAVPFGFITATQAVLRAQDRPIAFVWITVLSTLGAQSTGLLGAILTRDALGYLAGVAGGYIISAMVGLVSLQGIPRKLPGGSTIRAALRLGAPTIPHGLAIYALAVADRVIVERLMGLDQVGRYQVAYLVGGVGISLAAAFNNAWAPQIYAAEQENRWALLAATSAAVTRVFAWLAISFIFATPVILAFVAPSTYSPASLAPVSTLVALAVLPYVSYLSAVHAIFQQGITRVLVIAAPLAVFVNLGLNAALIPSLGLAGSAIATVVAYLLLASIVTWRVRAFRIPWRTGHMLRSWIVVLAATTVVIIVAPITSKSIVFVTIAAVVSAVKAIHSIRLLAA